jgi:hypothetical protein
MGDNRCRVRTGTCKGCFGYACSHNNKKDKGSESDGIGCTGDESWKGRDEEMKKSLKFEIKVHEGDGCNAVIKGSESDGTCVFDAVRIVSDACV